MTVFIFSPQPGVTQQPIGSQSPGGTVTTVAAVPPPHGPPISTANVVREGGVLQVTVGFLKSHSVLIYDSIISARTTAVRSLTVEESILTDI